MESEHLIPVDRSLLEIAREIVRLNLSDSDWAGRESDDEFQRGAFVGGYDADERSFCFSVDREGTELWLQLSSDDIAAVAAGRMNFVSARPADL